MLEEPFPTDIYLDTDVVVKAIVGGMDHSTACLRFCSELAQHESRVYFSQILRLEFSQAFKQLATKAQLPESIRDVFGLDQWSDYMVRGRWMQFGVSQFAAFLGQFVQVIEFPFRRGIWESSVKIMAFHNLRSHDAIHVATARHLGVKDFATSDNDFQHIDALTVRLIRDTV